MFSQKPIPKIPAEAAPVDRQVYNIQNIYLQIGDNLENIFAHIEINSLDPTSRLDISAVRRLSLVSAFQIAESLPDEAASEASMKRMDWKYALHLPANHPCISKTALCEFRQNLIVSFSGMGEFDSLIYQLYSFGLYSKKDFAMFDTGRSLNAVCQINRLHHLHQALKNAFSSIISTDPNWMINHVSPHWYERYQNHPIDPAIFLDTKKLLIEAEQLGSDIHSLLESLKQQDAAKFSELPEIRVLERLFCNQFLIYGDIVRWQNPKCSNCGYRDLI